LVEHGTLAIDETPAVRWTVDKIFVRGHFYSDKPPTMSLLAAAIYYPLYHAGFRLKPPESGDEFGSRKPERNLSYGLITFVLMAGSTLCCLAAFYGALGFVGLPARRRVWMTAGLAFATLFLPWTTTLNNHAFSGSWTFIAFYFLLRAKSAPEKVAVPVLVAGAAAGLAAASDPACLLFVVGFGAYILGSAKLRRVTVWYAAAALLIMLPGILVNYSITGDLRPPNTHVEYFDYPGSYWLHGHEALSGVTRNDLGFALKYGFLCLFGPNGFLLYNPLLAIAIYYAVRLVTSRQPFWIEALLVLVLVTMFTGYFFLYSSNYGGYSYSIRWFVTLIPLVWFFAFPFFAEWTPAKSRIYTGLFVLSSIVAFTGLWNPWPWTLGTNTPAFVLNWRDRIIPTLARRLQ